MLFTSGLYGMETDFIFNLDLYWVEGQDTTKNNYVSCVIYK